MTWLASDRIFMLDGAMVALAKTSRRMTVAEFLDWDSGDRTGRRWQLVDGEPQAMAPASEIMARS